MPSGARPFLDATDGVNGRQLWVSDGTANGTQVLGAAEAVSPVVWVAGLLFRSTANELVDQRKHLRAWTNPSWDDDLQENVANPSGRTTSGRLGSTLTNERCGYIDGTGDEPYRLDVNGVLTAWTINEFGSAHLADFVSLDDDAVAAASRGGVKQVLRLYDNGSHGWLTAIAPTSGDTHLGEGMGLHLMGDNSLTHRPFQASPDCGRPTQPTVSRSNSARP